MLTWNCDRPGCSAVEDAEWMRVEIDTSARRVRLHSPDWHWTTNWCRNGRRCGDSFQLNKHIFRGAVEKTTPNFW